MPGFTFTATGTITTGTEIDVSSFLDNAMDTRSGVDPIRQVTQSNDAATGSAQDLTSTGQGTAGDPASGEVAVVNGHTLALGHQIAAGDKLDISFDTQETNQVL